MREELIKSGKLVRHLDGDEVRRGYQKKLGFSKQDRDKNIKIAINLATKYQSQGYIVIASFISPYVRHRNWGREKLNNFIEIFVDILLDICESRDPKGIYRKAQKGEIEFFTDITDPYEKPKNPDIHLRTDQLSIAECTAIIAKYLKKSNLLNGRKNGRRDIKCLHCYFASCWGNLIRHDA